MGRRSGKHFRPQSKPTNEWPRCTNRVTRLAKRRMRVNVCAMITVTTCSNVAEAELLHSLLVENGIAAFVLDDAFGGMIRVQVDDENAEEAGRILAEAQTAFTIEDEDDAVDGDDTGEDATGNRAP